MKSSYRTDVPVALIFFNRPEVFSRIFECVRRNRPSKLFLIQDGPRPTSKTDAEKIKQCREICADVDWECEVYEDFSDVNLGCGKRIFTGLQNAFKVVDRLVIIEDDILFSDSFLPFCAELLEKYKDDQRIHQISGMNHFGEYQDCNNSYFFSRGGAIWGWATWKRVWDELDWNLKLADDEYISKTIRRNGYPRKYGKYLYDKSQEVRGMIKAGKAPTFWSFHLLFYSYLQNRLNIVPQKNLISNIGLTDESTHANSNLKIFPKHTQRLFFAPMYQMDFPLKHPRTVLDDKYYKEIQDEFMYPTGLASLKSRIESKIRNILYR